MGRAMKRADKEMQKIKAEFKKNHVIMKKTKAAMAKMKSAGRYISNLPPEGWLTAFAMFVIYSQPAGGGKAKKALKKMVESHYPNAGINGDGEELMESLQEVIKMRHLNNELGELRLMEMDQVDEEIFDEILFENEHLVLQMIDLVEEFDAPIYTGRLTVRKLNEQVKQMRRKNGKKVDRPEGGKQEQIKIFFSLYARFLEKLANFGITGPDKIEAFMLRLVEMIPRIQVRKKEAGVAKPKVRAAVPA